MSFFAFGGAWLAFGIRVTMASSAAALVVVALLTLSLCLLAFRVYRANAAASREAADLPPARRRRRLFHWINVGQWVLIVGTTNLLVRFGLSRWVVPSVIGIVGLHILPLARVFSYRAHYVTGAALLLLALGCVLQAPSGPVNGIGPMGAGVVLWLSSAWALASPGT